jgi:hypothetical protein
MLDSADLQRIQLQDDHNEEDLYGAVLRSSSGGKKGGGRSATVKAAPTAKPIGRSPLATDASGNAKPYDERMRERKMVVGSSALGPSKKKDSPSEKEASGIKALNLEPSSPVVAEKQLQDFEHFKEAKSKASSEKKSATELKDDHANFSRSLEDKGVASKSPPKVESGHASDGGGSTPVEKKDTKLNIDAAEFVPSFGKPSAIPSAMPMTMDPTYMYPMQPHYEGMGMEGYDHRLQAGLPNQMMMRPMPGQMYPHMMGQPMMGNPNMRQQYFQPQPAPYVPGTPYYGEVQPIYTPGQPPPVHYPHPAAKGAYFGSRPSPPAVVATSPTATGAIRPGGLPPASVRAAMLSQCALRFRLRRSAPRVCRALCCSCRGPPGRRVVGWWYASGTRL